MVIRFVIGHCLDACRVSHLMRSSPLGVGSGPASRLSEALRVAVMDLVGCGLSLGAWEQATLPIHEGGLGIRTQCRGGQKLGWQPWSDSKKCNVLCWGPNVHSFYKSE